MEERNLDKIISLFFEGDHSMVKNVYLGGSRLFYSINILVSSYHSFDCFTEFMGRSTTIQTGLLLPLLLCSSIYDSKSQNFKGISGWLLARIMWERI